MKYYSYILQSEKDGSFYIGSTSDIERRLMEHNFRLSPYTSSKRPWKIFYFEEFDSKKEAIKKEKFFKKQKSRDFYINLSNNKENA